MTWRLAHPVRGIVAFLVVFALGASIAGFGVGVLELALLGLGSIAAFVWASCESNSV